jgi:hypothetical protein
LESWIFPDFFLVILLFIWLLFFFFLSRPIRKRLIEISSKYEKYLHIIVISRLALLFFTPIMFWLAVFGFASTVNQLLSLVVIGGSIVAFWIVELPLLLRASIDVTFATQISREINLNNEICRKKFLSEPTFEPAKAQFVVVRVFNLGFHTYENFTVTVYFGKDFEIISANDDKHGSRYDEMDFQKPFALQRAYGGVRFTPSDENWMSIPPQGAYLFPILIIPPRDAPNDAMITTEFPSDNCWGITRIRNPYKIGQTKSPLNP